MEAIGQLTGGIAHDFNNLLTVISGNAEIMLGWSALDPAKTRRMLGGIQRAAERGAHLTQQLLAFARRQPLRPQSHSVRALVGSFESVLRRARGDLAELEFDLFTRSRLHPGRRTAIRGRAPQPRRQCARRPAARRRAPDRNADPIDRRAAHAVRAIKSGDYVVVTVADTRRGHDARDQVRGRSSRSSRRKPPARAAASA